VVLVDVTFLTEQQTDDLLAIERRVLSSNNGDRVRCEAFIVVWQAFDELVRPPIGLDRFEIIERSWGLARESGKPFDACFEAIVRVFHSQVAPPSSLRIAPLPRRAS